jgi:hypothetical protein
MTKSKWCLEFLFIFFVGGSYYVVQVDPELLGLKWSFCLNYLLELQVRTFAPGLRFNTYVCVDIYM